MCHTDQSWSDVLLWVLLGFRSAWREDLKATPAMMVYGEPLRLPGEFFSPRTNPIAEAHFAAQLRGHMQQLHPLPITRHGEKAVFQHRDLASSSQVFVRHEATKRALQPPYDGPFEVLNRTEKYFTLRVNGKESTVSIDRLKPAFFLKDDSPQDRMTTTSSPSESQEAEEQPRTTMPPASNGQEIHCKSMYESDGNSQL
ncbi:uncharacterized protein [Hetaerina americana]|uniref:uncharacterized protein n=1 Tax=Hetaerina americana TaxID=62018 RepID=UPI003A7F154B